MEIALIIVGGLTLATLFASFFDYLGKKQKRYDSRLENRVHELEEKIRSLEEEKSENGKRYQKIESDVAFLGKLIEDKRE